MSSSWSSSSPDRKSIMHGLAKVSQISCCLSSHRIPGAWVPAVFNKGKILLYCSNRGILPTI